MHQLQGMLDGAILQPLSTTLVALGIHQPNLVYSYWLRFDQLILVWIFAIISKDTLCEVHNASQALPI